MNRIFITYDGSDPAEEAMNFTLELVRRYNSELYVVAVCQLPEFSGEIEMQDFASRA